MRVAITGATGGLGRSLTEFLLEKGMKVSALGRNEKIGAELSKQGADFFAGDLSNTEYLKNSFKKCDAVIHCAGLASPFGNWEEFHQANVLGTRNVLEALKANSITKLVHISTPSVYFSGKDRKNVREDSPLPRQKSFYGQSKLMADELVIRETKERNLNSALIRPRAIIGKYDTTIIPRILKVLRKGTFPLPDGGKALVDVTAVENVCHGIYLILNSEKHFKAEIFNISNGQPVSVKDLTAKLADAFQLKVKFIPVPMPILRAAAFISEKIAKLGSNTEPVISKYAIESLGTTQTLSIEKAKSLLNYSPILSTEQAIENYIQFIRSKS